MIIADTSGLLAWFNSAEPRHLAVAEIVASDDLVVPPYVVAELDYLVVTRIGVAAELEMLAELASGAYTLAPFEQSDLRQAVDVVDRYRDQEIGIADASIVVLCQRMGTNRVLTLDRRHFDVLRTMDGGAFEVLPD